MSEPKGIRFDLPEELHRKLKVKLASEGRQAKELYLTLTEIYVKEEDGKKTKNEPGKGSRKS